MVAADIQAVVAEPAEAEELAERVEAEQGAVAVRAEQLAVAVRAEQLAVRVAVEVREELEERGAEQAPVAGPWALLTRTTTTIR